jgi:sulfite exporter TauE/SafE
MTGGLLLSAALMGLAGNLHCAAMCSAGCGALARGCVPAAPPQGLAALLGGRLAGYALAGLLAGAATGSLAWLAGVAGWFKPLWTMMQAGALALGLWLLLRARVPAWLDRLGARLSGAPAPRADGLAVVHGPGRWRAAGLGSLWTLMPCGLLHAALLVAALSSSPLEGAAVMAVFALASTPGLVAGPALWWRLRGRAPAAADAAARDGQGLWALRLAGLTLAALSAWGLGRHLWAPFIAWCTT